MGKGKSPTPEELEFIYRLLADGAGVSDVIDRYKNLDKYGKLGALPFRYDVRFMRQRRREFEAARRVLEQDFKRRADPVLVQHRTDHYKSLCEVLNRLINDLSTPVLGHLNLNRLESIQDFASRIGGYGWIYETMHEKKRREEQASITLRVERDKPLLWACLGSHLEAELPSFADRLTAWKRVVAEMIEKCHSAIGSIREEARKGIGLDFIEHWSEPGLSMRLINQVYEFAMKNYGKETEPQIHYDERPRPELIELWDSTSELVIGHREHIDACRKAYPGMMKKYANSEEVREILAKTEQVEALKKPFSEELVLIWHRATFEGTCQICQPWGAP